MPIITASTFSSLVYFETCGRLLSFSKAAQELSITTGAVSQQIRKLEERLEFKLFKRHPRGITLTDEGVELLAITNQSLESIQATIKRLQMHAIDGPVQIKSTPSIVFKWLIPALKTFNEAHPDVIVETYAEASLLDFDKIEFDLAIDYSMGRYNNIDAILLTEEILYPVISPSYMPGADWSDPKAWEQVVLLHDSMPWLGASKDEEWRYWLNSQGKLDVDSKQGHYFNRSDMAIAAATAGLGMALARGNLVVDEAQSGALISPLPAVASCCKYYLLTPQGKPTNSKAKILRQWLADMPIIHCKF